MRRLVLAAIAGTAAAATVIAISTAGGADQGAARLTIRAVGADMEFRAIDLSPDAFTVRDGESRIFQNLKPGRYVVVQAPPVGGGLRVECSDGVSNMAYDLGAGDDLACTFSVTP